MPEDLPPEMLRKTVTELGIIARVYKATSEATHSSASKMSILTTQRVKNRKDWRRQGYKSSRWLIGRMLSCVRIWDGGNRRLLPKGQKRKRILLSQGRATKIWMSQPQRTLRKIWKTVILALINEDILGTPGYSPFRPLRVSPLERQDNG